MKELTLGAFVRIAESLGGIGDTVTNTVHFRHVLFNNSKDAVAFCKLIQDEYPNHKFHVIPYSYQHTSVVFLNKK